jgi:hypothetical protein
MPAQAGIQGLREWPVTYALLSHLLSTAIGNLMPLPFHHPQHAHLCKIIAVLGTPLPEATKATSASLT